MFTIGICDDNVAFATKFSNTIRDLSAKIISERINCRIAPVFNKAMDVIEYLKNSSINILFLDIDMPDMNGFKLAEYLSKHSPETVIIFVSSYEEYVYSSFEYCPFRFLRKTHLDKELYITFKKAIEKCIINNEVLSFNTVEGEELLRIRDIVLLEGQKNYYVIYTTAGVTYKCRGTLSSIEKELIKFDFFRVQSSYIVNFEYIETLDNKYIIMKNNISISVSRGKYNEFKTLYMQYIRRRITNQ